MNFFLFFLFLISSFPKSLSALNEKYDSCSKALECGALGHVSYPFYDGSTRPDYCGYPGFKVSCDADPQITISKRDYYLRSTVNGIITVSRTDKWGSYCPDGLTNTTIDFSIFNFSSFDQNITFFYNCGDNTGISSLTATCAGLPSGLPGYYLTEKMLKDDDGHGLLELLGICKSNLFLPILESEAEKIDSQPQDMATLINAFQAGFELEMKTEMVRDCDVCKLSSGECGYDWSRDKFVCYCADANYDTKCPEIKVVAGHKKTLAIGVSVAAVALVAILIGGCSVFIRRRRRKFVADQEKPRDIFPAAGPASSGKGDLRPGSNGQTSSRAYTTTPSTNDSHSMPSYASSTSEIGRGSTYFGVRVFDYTELEQATDNFHDSRELGDGGFGTVYYGVLLDGRQVAVKRLYENSFKRVEQYMNEIEILAELRHRHLVALYGCTSRRSRELLLVYEYISNGTVADHLHGKHSDSSFLNWPIRLSIAVQTAEALAFLHRSKVIHRDVKTTNILLDKDFHVKVADFGLSRLFPTDMTHVSTAPQGTPGYVDPDYYQCYRLTEKSDVYSFGVVLMELISSKQAVDVARHRHDVNLAGMAVDRIQNRALAELVDPKLGFEKEHAVRRMVEMVAELGFRCLQQDRDMRPTMEEVEEALRGVLAEGAKVDQQEVMDVAVDRDDVGLMRDLNPSSPEVPMSN